jgi:hypothetical protein
MGKENKNEQRKKPEWLLMKTSSPKRKKNSL